MIKTFRNLLLISPKILNRTIICPTWYSGDQKDIKVFRKAIVENDIPKMQEYYNKVHPYTQYLGLMDAIRTHNYAVTEILLDKIKDTSGTLDLLCDEDIGRYELGDTPLKLASNIINFMMEVHQTLIKRFWIYLKSNQIAS